MLPTIGSILILALVVDMLFAACAVALEEVSLPSLRRQAGERRRQQTREGERGAPAPSSPAPRARTEPPDARYSADLEQTRRLVERIRSGGA